MNTIIIDKAELEAVYYEMRELAEGREAYRVAAEHGITFLFEALGEPGAGE